MGNEQELEVSLWLELSRAVPLDKKVKKRVGGEDGLQVLIYFLNPLELETVHPGDKSSDVHINEGCYEAQQDDHGFPELIDYI